MIALCYALVGVLTGRHFKVLILICEMCFSGAFMVLIMSVQGRPISLILQDSGVALVVLQIGFLLGAFSTICPSSEQRVFAGRKKRLSSPQDRG